MADEGAIETAAELLGRPVVYTDGQGYECEIVGATVGEGGRRVAWVEGRSKSFEDVVDVAFVLHATVAGANHLSWTVETYNPYFGCEVEYMGWRAEEIVLVYREKHKTLLAVVGPGASPRLYPLGEKWWLDNDVAYFLSEHAEELIEGVRVPQLTRITPHAAATRMNEVLPVSIPEDVPRFQAELRRELFGDNAPQPEADLVIGAVAHRFWDRWPEATAAYPHGLTNPWNSPQWLPLYWHLATRERGTERLLALLDSLAESASSVPPTSPLSAAVDYVRGRSRPLAAACRSGSVPEGAYCTFWVEWSVTAFRRYLNSFPAGFREAFKVLRAQEKRWRELPSVS